MQRFIGIVSFLACAACSPVDDEESAATLQFVLAEDSARAGDAVGWSAEVVESDGSTRQVTVSLASDREPDVAFSGAHVFPRAAGTHRLVAKASFDGQMLMAHAMLDVGPGPAADLDVVLTDDVLVAGEWVGLQVEAHDAFGNVADQEGVVLSPDATLALEDGQLTSERVGTWWVTAELDGLTDRVPVEVVPAAPAEVFLSVETFPASARTSVRVLDRFGHPVSTDVRLVVHGLDHDVVGPVVFFHEEGEGTILACVEYHPCSDPVGVIIDWSPPVVAFERPVKNWLDEAPGTDVTVSGTATDDFHSVSEVMVNGTTIPVNSGKWELDLPVAFGLNRFEAVVPDTGTGPARALRVVVAGDKLDLGVEQPDGLLVRLNEDDAGLGVVEAIAVDDLAAVDLAAEVPSPFFNRSLQECTGIGAYQVCVTTVRLTLAVDEMRYAHAVVDLNGHSDGTLDGTMVWTDYEVDWTGTGKVASSSFSQSTTGTASALTMRFQLTFDVDGGVIDVTATDVEVELTDFQLGAGPKVTAAGLALGQDVDELVASAVIDAAEDALPPVVEEAVEGALTELGVSIGWAHGASLSTSASEVVVDGDGIVVSFDSVADLSATPEESSEMGALVADYGVPEWSVRNHPASLALSFNLLNQVFYANWAGGFIEKEGGPEVFDIDPAVVSAALPGIRDLVGTMRAKYPPFFVLDGSAQARMELPELRFDLYDGEVIEDNAVYTIFITVSTPVEFGLHNNRLDLVWGSHEVWMDVETAPAEADLYFLEALLETVSAGLVLNDYELVDALPLPVIDGYTFTGAEVVMQGPEGAFVVVEGGF